MRLYNYWLITLNDEYAQEVLPEETAEPQGTVMLAIYPTSTGNQDNIKFADCSYVALTRSAEIDDKYVIQYGKERLKVRYIQPLGRLKQVFLKQV